MKRSKFLLNTCLIGAASIALASPAFAQEVGAVSSQADQQQAEEDEGGVGTIVVTARKRSENMQEVPISMTAVDAEAIDNLGLEDLSDVAKFAPNVSFDGTAATSGSSIASTIFIRGIGQTDFTLNSDPGVGVYVDGVYVARSVGGLLDLVDLESVEVLRGPQGTLFGKNTVGGAINVRSRRPGHDGYGFAKIEAGNFNRINLMAGFDVSVSDTLAVGFSGAFLNQDGYQERLLQPEEESLGNINRYVVRGRGVWQPSDNFTADLVVDYTRGREESVPQSVVKLELGTGAPFIPAALGLIPGTTPQIRPKFATGGFTATQFLNGDFFPASRRETFYGGPSRSDFDIFGAALTLSLELGPVEFKTISAYRETDSDFARDSTSSPFIAADTVDLYDQQQFTQEFQILGEAFGGKLDYVAGLFYLSEKGRNDNLVATSIGDLRSGGSVNNESLALFAQTNLDVSDRLKLTAGIRYTDETKRFDPGYQGGEQLFIVNANGAAIGLPPAGTPIPLIVSPESLGLGNYYVNSDDKVDVTFAANYEITDDVRGYLSYSTGFKAGGFSQRIGPGPGIPAPQFRRESVETYEGGIKSTLFDNTLRLNAAVFYTNYNDLQVTPIFEGIGPVTRNIGDAKIFGLEAEFNWVPSDTFELSGGIGYLDDQLKSLTPEAAVNRDLSGNQILTLDTQLAKTPTWSASAAAVVKLPVSDHGEIVLRGNWSFTSSLFNDVLNSSSLRRPSVHLFGAGISYETLDGNWVFSLTGKNLTNKEYIIAGNDETAAGQFGYAQATFSRPREWWFSIKRNF